MKKSSRRALSRLLASVMLISSIFGTTYVNGADTSVKALAESTTSGSALDPSTSGGALGTPVAGKTYTATFSGSGVASGTLVGGTTYADDTIMIVSPDNKAYFHDDSHGLALTNGDQIQVAVAGNADITLGLCQYGNGTEYAVTDAAGNTVGAFVGKGATDGELVTLSYTGDATTLTLTLSSAGEAYLHSVSVANAAAPVGEAENFELWLDDIATDVSSVDEATGETIITKTIDQQTIMYKDSALTLVGNKDGATGELKKFTPEWGNGKDVVRAGKTVNGYKAGPRHATANDIPSVPQFGDGTAIVFSPAATGTFNAYIASTSFLRVWDFDAATGERYGYTDSDVAVESYAFKAQAGHTYVLSTTGKTNNMVYCGFEYIIDEPTTVAFSLNNINAKESSIPTLEVYLTDAALGKVEATVTVNTTELTLAKGHTYKLSTNDGGVKASVAGSDSFKATGDAVVIDLEDIPDQTLTGEITGTPEGTVSELTFTNQLNGTVYTATITGSTYSCVMKPGEYNTAVVTNNGGVTYDHVSVVQGAENTNEVYVEVPVDDGSKNYDLPTEIAANETDLTFISANEASPIRGNNSTSIRASAGDSITVPVSGVQKVTVAGWYAGTWDINGQNSVTTNSGASASAPTTNSYITDGTETFVTVNITGEGANYLYWIKIENCIAFTSEINVPEDYATLNEADDAINAMVGRPEGEDGRVTINLNTDLEEQVTFDAPYVTLNGNGHELTWYYGVGTFYYSIDKSTGLYSERLFRDKYSAAEGDGSLWGGVAIIRGDHFIAENTTFKNTYNYYVTDKEAADVAYTVGGIPMRTKDTDVTKYVSKERSNAFYIAADDIEVYRCNILSSQDTLGRNGSANNGYHTYFKDCVIGGNTDYICGEFTAIFDNCDLQWKTFKDDATNNGKIGFITAPKTSPYIFRNCTVTTDGVGTDVAGTYGRTWGKESNAIFINTETNGYIKADGWGEMSAGELATAKFQEFNNTSKGEAFASTVGTVLSDADAAVMTSDDVIDAYLAGWTPVHYSYETRFTGLWGDADMSGLLTANDASAVLAYVLNPALADSDYYDFRGCDVDDNGEITAADASMILQKVLDSEYTFPAEPTTESTTEALPIDEAANYVPADKAENSLAKAVVYNGVDAQIVAMQAMKYTVNLDGSMTVIGNNSYPGYAATTSVNTPMTVDGVLATGWRVAYAITAKNDVKVNVDVKVNNGKAVFLTTEEPVENANIKSVASFENTADDMFTTISASIKAGETLYVIGKGTNLPIYAVRFGDDQTTTEDTTETTTAGEPINVFVVGDSTACNYAATADTNYYYKRVGFGDKIADYATSNVTVVNLALSGRSSKSFTSEANYTTLKNDIKAGDILLIAFGHNDEKSDDSARYTAPNGVWDSATGTYTAGSFKESLYTNYVKLAQDAGATPIVCSPIVRRTDSGTWSESQLHKANGGDYAADAKALAEEQNIGFIDLTALTQAKYDELTPAKSVNLHAWTNSKSTSVDNTHLNNYGAKEVAYLIATNPTAELAPYIAANPVEPTEKDLVVNPDYVESSADDLTGDELNSLLWTTTSPWRGTVFGDIGGQGKLNGLAADGVTTDPTTLADANGDGVPNFLITENSDGSVRIKAGTPNTDDTALESFGKIAGTSDGLAMYYQPVDVQQNFSISAKAHVTNVAKNNNQTAFGAIVADKVLVDVNNKITVSNYVAASPLKMQATVGTADATTGANIVAWAGYARIADTLTQGAATLDTQEALPKGGDVIDVKITKLGNKYTVEYGGQTSEFTVDMTGTVYVGVFAARCADVTFTDIVYNNEVVE